MIKSDSLKKIYDEILLDIQRYSPYPEKVKLLFVTKYFDVEVQKKLIEYGFNYFGENRPQLYRDKVKSVGCENIKWDFIGNLQKNKIKYIIDSVNLIHSIDSFELLEEINKKASEINRRVNVLIQINISKEDSKSGISVEEFENVHSQYFSFEYINICGFMTMLPFESSKEELNSYFSQLFDLKKKYATYYPSLVELSMGMSSDYIEALKQGATIIRIGSLFLE